MSITSEIKRIEALRNSIRGKLTDIGLLSNAAAKLEECASALNNMVINNKVNKTLSEEMTSVSIPKGYHKEAGMVSVLLQEKTQNVAYGSVEVIPDDGKLLKKVTVNGPANKAGKTLNAAAVTQDDNNTYFDVPEAGYYDTTSKICTANSNLKSKGILSYASSIEVMEKYCNLNIDNSKRQIKTVTINSIFSYYMKVIANGTELISINNEQYSKIPVSVDVSSYDSFIIQGYAIQYNSAGKNIIDMNSILIN